MKKAIFTLLVALATTMSYAQVKVSTTSTTNLYSTQMSQIRMVKITIDSSSQYVLYYKNLKYTTITDIDYITFNDPQEALDFLSLLNGVAETGNNVIVTIGNQNLSIQKGMGERATVFHDGGFFYLSKKQSLEMIAILEKENQ